MNRTDRLYALVEELRAVAPRPRSARWLATRFEVSTRTVERDISALQQSGVPIWVSLGRTGGYALDRSRTLPPLNMTPGEAVAIAVALHRLDDTPFHAAARSALHKLLAVMPAADVTRAEDLAARIHLVRGGVPGRSSRGSVPPPGPAVPPAAAVSEAAVVSDVGVVSAVGVAAVAALATAAVPAAAGVAVAASPGVISAAAAHAAAIAPGAASSVAVAAASGTPRPAADAVPGAASSPAAGPGAASSPAGPGAASSPAAGAGAASAGAVSAATGSPVLVEAFTTGRVLDIAYADRFGVTTRRQIEPAGYLGGPAGWYLLAWCRLRGELRSFRVDRIHEVVATAELAARRPLPDRALDIPGHLVTRVAMAA